MEGVSLVLEGGGMRGVYTSGVLEYFMEQEMYFPYVIGVSAGAGTAASYLSRQRDRNRKVNIDYVTDSNYISFKNLLTKRQIFGMDFIFDDIPNRIVPYDYEAFHAGKEEFVIGTTDIETGQPTYFTRDMYGSDVLTVVRASSSLPFVAPIIEYGGKKLLEGGISDPIPVRKAMSDGFNKSVIVLTRNKGYSKKKSNMGWVVGKAYKDYPKLVEAIVNRYEKYNETLKDIDELEKNGDVFVIRPSIPLEVGRIERNPVKLSKLYDQGYLEAQATYGDLLKWMQAT